MSDQMQQAASTPGHVPPELVRSIEAALGPNTLDDPFAPAQAVLADYPPLFYTPGSGASVGGGLWVATRYEDIREVFQNTSRYTSVGVYPWFDLAGEPLRAIPISFDPPQHDMYRVLLNPWFSPKAVTGLESQIHGVVTELIDGFADKGGCDAYRDFGRIYPVRVFMNLMGFPLEMFEDFLAWGHAIHFGSREEAVWGVKSALAFVRDFVEQVRAAPPAETLASRIVRGEVDGRPMTDDEVIGTVFFLWDGGLDTVAAENSLMFRRLALDPELQQTLRDKPELIPDAIEEFLRMNPTVNTVRIAKVDHELRGVKIKAGERVLCLVAAGNFDESEFEDPLAFRLDRASNRHLTFVAGPHRCLGSHLARRELKIALGEFLRRIPPFRLEPDSDRLVIPGMLATPQLPIVWG